MTAIRLEELLQPPTLSAQPALVVSTSDLDVNYETFGANPTISPSLRRSSFSITPRGEESTSLNKLFGPLQLAGPKSSVEGLPNIHLRPHASTDPGFCSVSNPLIRQRLRQNGKNMPKVDKSADCLSVRTPSFLSPYSRKAYSARKSTSMVISGSLQPIAEFIATYPRGPESQHQHPSNSSYSLAADGNKPHGSNPLHHHVHHHIQNHHHHTPTSQSTSRDASEKHEAVPTKSVNNILRLKPLAMEGAMGQHTSLRAELRTSSTTGDANAADQSTQGAKKPAKNAMWGKLGSMVAPHAAHEPKDALDLIVALQGEDKYSLSAMAAKRQSKLTEKARAMDTGEGADDAPPAAEAVEPDAAEPPDAEEVAKDVQVKMPDTPLEQILAVQQMGWEVGITDIRVLHPCVLDMMLGRFHKSHELKHRHRKKMMLVQANPVAFIEESAKNAEAQYRALSEKARLRLAELTSQLEQERSTQEFRSAVLSINLHRPVFLPPVMPTEIHQRGHYVDLDKKEEKPAWRLDESVFVQRKKDADSRDYFDNDRLMLRQFNTDFDRVKAKSRFKRMVARDDAGIMGDPKQLERELKEIYNELIAYQYKRLLRSAFTYYSCYGGSTSSGSMLEMSLVQFHKFCQDCNIPDNRTCKSTDLDTMFISTNFEEESNTQESDANDDNALCRFEFLEIIVRIAFGKYIYSKEMKDASDSVARLMSECIEASLPPEAKIDPDIFRRNRFYKAEVEAVLLNHWDLLQSVFKVYKARDRTKYFWVEHWFAFLESLDLLGDHTGLDKHTAKLIFCYSQMAVADELKRRQRAVSILFFDFLECLGRLAEVISPPTKEQLEKAFAMSPVSATTPTLVWEYYQRVKQGTMSPIRRASGGLCAEPTRCLGDKLAQLMEVMVVGLKAAWGGNAMGQVVMRMNKMAMLLSGGIEMG